MKQIETSNGNFSDTISHRLFKLTHMENDINYAQFAKQIGVNRSRLWHYVNGHSKWPADAWLKVMTYLGVIDLDVIEESINERVKNRVDVY